MTYPVGRDSGMCTQISPALPTSKKSASFPGFDQAPGSEILALDLGVLLCVQMAWVMGLGVDFAEVGRS